MNQFKLYIGNLPYSVQGNDLKTLFEQAGDVVHAEVQTDYNNRSKGYGLVVFGTREEAERGIGMFNGYDLVGRAIEVREDRKSSTANSAAPVDLNNKRAQFVHKHDPNSVNGTTLFVGNLPWSVAWQDLKDLFRQAGVVTRADIALDHQQRRSRGFGTVTMGSIEEARKAVSLFNGYEWKGRKVEVRENRPFHNPERDLGRIVYVRNLPITAGWQDLKDIFRPHGDVRRADIALDAQGNPSGFGSVVMSQPSEVKCAIEAFSTSGAVVQGILIELSEVPFEV